MKYIFFSALILLVVGCASIQEPVINTVIQRVEIPIAVSCKVAMPTKPDYNFDKLTVDQNIFEKTRALLADRKLSESYQVELSAALESCIK